MNKDYENTHNRQVVAIQNKDIEQVIGSGRDTNE